MPDKKFKVMVRRILTRLEERMEDLSETLNRDRKYIKEPVRNEELSNRNKKYPRGNQ